MDFAQIEKLNHQRDGVKADAGFQTMNEIQASCDFVRLAVSNAFQRRVNYGLVRRMQPVSSPLAPSQIYPQRWAMMTRGWSPRLSSEHRRMPSSLPQPHLLRHPFAAMRRDKRQRLWRRLHPQPSWIPEHQSAPQRLNAAERADQKHRASPGQRATRTTHLN